MPLRAIGGKILLKRFEEMVAVDSRLGNVLFQALVKSRKISVQLHNLEEELNAIRKPATNNLRTIDRNLSAEESDARRDEASARILAKLMVVGEITGTVQDLRTLLRMDDLSVTLFKKAARYLASNEPGTKTPPRIIFRAISEYDRGQKTNEPRNFRMKFIKQ